MTTLPTRFWAKVDRRGPDECWPWLGSTNKSARARANNLPYGLIRGDGGRRARTLLAHRVAYVLTHGAIEETLVIRHRCDNSLCCNPSHLVTGTHSDNRRDAIERGRAYINVDGRRGKKNGSRAA